MTAVDCNFATLDDALRTASQPTLGVPHLAGAHWKSQRRQAFRSVFQTDISQPTPNATPIVESPDQGQAFGLLAAAASTQPRGGRGARRRLDAETSFSQSQESEDLELPDANDDSVSAGATAGQHQGETAADDQFRFDRAWHVVTARISLPSSVSVEDSFGTLAPESQLPASQDAATEAEFKDALRLVLHARSALPRATHVEDIVSWHTLQVRRHYAQHVLPMLSACVGEAPVSVRQGEAAAADDSRYYDHHMNVVVNSVRTLEAAFRLYFYGLMIIVRGLPSDNQQEHDHSDGGGGEDRQLPLQAESCMSRFRQDVNALVANSTPPGLVTSIRVVFTQFANVILGFNRPKLDQVSAGNGSSSNNNNTPFRRRSAHGAPISPIPKQRKKTASTRLRAPPRPPADTDSRVQLLRRQMQEVLAPLHSVGLAGENFQILFAEIMDEKMIEFIKLSFAGRWSDPDMLRPGDGASLSAAARYKHRLSKGQISPSSCIGVLYDWIENHFARLAHEVLGVICTGSSGSVSFSDVKKWKEVALGRLSTLRMTELFDIVLHWPQSRGGLEDLRVSVTTPQRRSQLVSTFSAALRKRLLHPACSTLEILQIYIAMIRTFHVLDPSNVLLSAAVGPLQFYLCQREDAVRIVVDGLLADPEDALASSGTVAERIAQMRSASAASAPNGTKLAELAGILNDPSQQRRRHSDEEELDWNDMEWMPDPIDAGTNYRRPKSEDVIGTLISALGSREAFTKEFQNIIAERLLSPQVVFSKEVKVLNLLKKRFGEGSMQNCEVMIRDIQDSNRLDAIIHQHMDSSSHAQAASRAGASASALEYQAKILSRLYWPGLGREMFLLPRPVADKQALYGALYEESKDGRKLAWLNHLGQAAVELELEDRTVAVDCKTYEAAVIYAFQGEEDDHEHEEEAEAVPKRPARRSVSELVDMLQMDEDLVALALAFWQKEGVLRQDAHSPDSYIVVESLAAAAEARAEAEAEAVVEGEAESEAGAGDSTQGGESAAAPAAAQSKRQARADDAQRTVYWQFIVGMLTNSAASMPLAQIAMMMKMLMAEGFPWSNEELQEFLGEKVTDGEMEVVGGKYRLAKK